MYKSPQSTRYRRTMQEIDDLRMQIEEMDENVDPKVRADVEKRLAALESIIHNLSANWNPETNSPRLLADDVAEVIGMWTGIPVMTIAEEESQRLLKMEDALHSRIIGQHEAIVTISKAVRRARAGLKDPRRPIGSFIFLGPTGVGKTELTKALAEFLFGSEEALIHLDMSEFMERHNVARLTGAPPGYVGYEDAGQLTEAVRRRPYSIVVFDEIEKAHPEAHNMLLQIMEEGHLSDARGRMVDFRNCIIVMTSNIGANRLSSASGLGFDIPRDQTAQDEFSYTDMKKTVLEELRRLFKPEFLNRVDDVIVFRSLTQEEINQIVNLEIDKVRHRLIEHALTLDVTQKALAYLAHEGFDPEYGARPLRRVITNLIEDRLSDGILAGNFPLGSAILVDYDETEGHLTFTQIESDEDKETSEEAEPTS
jgi:ATP-dependent Clp protease ATP-binding subunit ClpC